MAGLYLMIPSLLSMFLLATEAAHSNPTDLTKVTAANAKFAINLYKQMVKGADDNLFLSPYSISTALAMAYTGTAGSSKQQMSDVVGFNNDVATVAQNFNDLSTHIIQDQGQLYEANRIFAQENHEFLEPFTSILANEFKAPLEQVNFLEKEEAATHINSWIASNTNQKIRDLIKRGDISDTTKLILINAIYFNATWLHPFNPNNTANKQFQVNEDLQVTVPMMKSDHQYIFGSSTSLGCTLATLPYEGEEVQMVILLPRGNLQDLEAKLNGSNFLQEIQSTSTTRRRVVMPKFTITHHQELTDPLEKLGMSDIFKQGVADLSGMDGSKKLYVSKVVHQAFVSVNEVGTEAAAATSVVVNSRMMIPDFEVNKPFMFILQHTETKEILFMGRVTNPTTTVMSRRSALVETEEEDGDNSDSNRLHFHILNIIIAVSAVMQFIF